MACVESYDDHVFSIIEKLSSDVKEVRQQLNDNNAILSEIREILKLIKEDADAIRVNR